MLSENDTMHLYMQNIGQYPLVTRREEAELAGRIAAGDESARTKLILGNLRLVVKIAHAFKGRGLPLLDLIFEGNTGLIRTVDKLDPTKGAKLSSYAAWWIKRAMRRGLGNQARTIRVPVQSAKRISRILVARIKLTEQLGREPTDKEIAEDVDLSERTVHGLRFGRPIAFSLHAPIHRGEEGEFQEMVPDGKAVAPDDQVRDLETLRHMLVLVDQLDERECTILKLRFGLNGGRSQSLAEVSQVIGLARERIRQIQIQALDKLRGMTEGDGHESGLPPGNGARQSLRWIGAERPGSSGNGQVFRQRMGCPGTGAGLQTRATAVAGQLDLDMVKRVAEHPDTPVGGRRRKAVPQEGPLAKRRRQNTRTFARRVLNLSRIGTVRDAAKHSACRGNLMPTTQGTFVPHPPKAHGATGGSPGHLPGLVLLASPAPKRLPNANGQVLRAVRLKAQVPVVVLEQAATTTNSCGQTRPATCRKRRGSSGRHPARRYCPPLRGNSKRKVPDPIAGS